jgi:RimJ/RimL family protein N-acetyltransferase
MLTFERSTDWGLITAIMTHRRVWPHISDDFSGPPGEFVPVDHPSFWYVVVREGTLPLGLFLLQPHNGVHWEVHTCLMPSGWRRGSREIARQAIAWLWQNATQLQRLTTKVPKNNLLALRFARDAGMVEYGTEPSSILCGGKLLDQALLGMNRPKEN